MPYEIEFIADKDTSVTKRARSLRDAQRLKKKYPCDGGLFSPTESHIYYISPDGSTRELIE